MEWVLLRLDVLASPSTSLPPHKYLANGNKETRDSRPVEKWNTPHVHGSTANLRLHYVVRMWSFIKEDLPLNVCKQPSSVSHVTKSSYLVVAFSYQAVKCYDD